MTVSLLLFPIPLEMHTVNSTLKPYKHCIHSYDTHSLRHSYIQQQDVVGIVGVVLLRIVWVYIRIYIRICPVAIQ